MNSLIIIKLLFSQQEHVQIFLLPLPSKTCALPFDFTLERDPKNIRTTSSLFCCSMIDMNKCTHNLRSVILVSILVLQVYYTCVTGLLLFFFVLQDLIDRIDSYLQRIALFTELASYCLLHPSLDGMALHKLERRNYGRKSDR